MRAPIKRRKVLMREQKFQKRDTNRIKYERLKAAGIRSRMDDELRVDEKLKYYLSRNAIPQVLL